MQRAACHVRLGTALFAHGTAGADKAELRPSAIKGAMRFWFRALCGNDLSLADLRRRESEVFGGPQTGEMLRLRIVAPQGLRDAVTQDCSPLPHKNIEARSGKHIAAIKAGTDLSIELTSFSKNEAAFELALWSLWAACTFGGFGQRCRRGAGSVIITGSEGFPPTCGTGPAPEEFSSAAAAIEKSYAACRSRLRELIGTRTRSAEDGLPDFPVLESSGIRCVAALLGEGTEQETRASLMLRLRDFKDPAFGLPLKLDAGWVAPAGSRRGDSLRHASPVWIRLVPIGPRWMAVITILPPFPANVDAHPEKCSELLTVIGAERIVLTPGG